jgi:hypothetical protein
MERQRSATTIVKRFIAGGLAALMLGGAGLAAPVAPVAASGAGLVEAPVAAEQQTFVVGFYVTGGKIVDLHQLIGEPFEQVVQRNTGARWEFAYDGAFRFIPADGSPALMGYWDVKRNQEVIEIEAYHISGSAEGHYEAGMKGQIDLKNGLARMEQARRVIQGGEAVASYVEFSIVLY